MTTKRSFWFFLTLLAVFTLVPLARSTGDTPEQAEASTSSRLATVWTSGDPDVAHRMALMYTHAAKRSKWFDEVRLVVWGPSARLLAADKDLQAKVAAMKKDGVDVKACVVCADSYGVTQALRDQGIEVLPMGKPLTDMLKSDWKVVTF